MVVAHEFTFLWQDVARARPLVGARSGDGVDLRVDVPGESGADKTRAFNASQL
jgi:hypothetical protein